MNIKLKEIQYNSILSSILGLILFLVTVIPKLTSIGVFLLVLTVIYGYAKKELIFKFNRNTIYFVLLYLFYLIGILFTQNYGLASKYAEYKLSFILFPILLSFQPKRILSLYNVFIIFMLGVFLMICVAIFESFSCFLQTHAYSCFLSSSLSTFIHPTYFSAYVSVLIAIIWVGYFQSWKYFNKWACGIITSILLLFNIFLLSLAGILFLGGMIVIGLGILFFKKFRFIGLGVYLIVIPLFIFFSTKIPQVKSELDDVKYYSSQYLENPREFFKSRSFPYSGTEGRIIMWTVSMDQIKHQPWGIGTGNVDIYLGKRLEKFVDKRFVEEELNPHNQFFQTTVEIGIFGLSTLLIIILSFLIYGFKTKNWIVVVVVASLTFNCLFESMLQRQSGIVFYTLLLCCLAIPNTQFFIPKSNSKLDEGR